DPRLPTAAGRTCPAAPAAAPCSAGARSAPHGTACSEPVPLKRSVTPALALCAVLAATGFTHPAAAQDSGGTAGRAFQAGTQADARGDFRVAAASFDEAYRIAPRGAAAYNAGLSWEAAGEAARASDDYARALRAGDLGTVERADTTGRLRNLESNKVGRVSVFAPDDARVSLDGRDVT